MRNRIKALALFGVALMLSLILNPISSSAQAGGSEAFDLSEEGLEALNKSIYINTVTTTVHVDKEMALSYYDFTDDELTAIQNELDLLTEAEVQEMINYSLQYSDDGMQLRSASVIIWVGIAVILAIVTTTSIVFSSKYMNYKEKQNLINKCYDAGGTPILDSGDTSDLGAEPEKAWWKVSNTYTFQCAT